MASARDNYISTSPAVMARVITPHDTNTVPMAGGTFPKALYVGTSGDVTLIPLDDYVDVETTPVAKTFKSVPVGILPVSFALLKSTGTTAADLVALY